MFVISKHSNRDYSNNIIKEDKMTWKEQKLVQNWWPIFWYFECSKSILSVKYHPVFVLEGGKIKRWKDECFSLAILDLFIHKLDLFIDLISKACHGKTGQLYIMPNPEKETKRMIITISITSKRKIFFTGFGVRSLREVLAKAEKSCFPTKSLAASLMAEGLSL